jgi:hypothetical protein
VLNRLIIRVLLAFGLLLFERVLAEPLDKALKAAALVQKGLRFIAYRDRDTRQVRALRSNLPPKVDKCLLASQELGVDCVRILLLQL